MARPRKPTALLELSGAYKINPGRRRENEPKESRALGEPPARLSADVLPYWNELVDMCGPVLTFRDRWAVELAAALMEKARRGKSPKEALDLIRQLKTDGAAAEKLKALLLEDGLSSAELSTLRSLLASFGMTPADRSKLSVPTEKPKNKFAALAQEGQRLNTRPN